MHVFRSASTGGGVKFTWGATHRGNLCEQCHIRFEDFDTGEVEDSVPVIVRQCPKCGGTVGELISRHRSLEAPSAPMCLRLSCIWQYAKDCILFALLASYEAKRVAYAEANRRNTILERYRIGEPAPQTIWQAIHANIKLRCPVCRKYNADPFLFRRREA